MYRLLPSSPPNLFVSGQQYMHHKAYFGLKEPKQAESVSKKAFGEPEEHLLGLAAPNFCGLSSVWKNKSTLQSCGGGGTP